MKKRKKKYSNFKKNNNNDRVPLCVHAHIDTRTSSLVFLYAVKKKKKRERGGRKDENEFGE